MAGVLELRIDTSQVVELAARFAGLGTEFPAAIARAINHTGDKAKTQMIRALVPQTGLKRGVIVRALKVSKASAGGAYVIRSRGGDISLKYFGARETRAGVSAAPHGQRQVFAGTFIKGGRFPNRVAIGKLNGHVFRRTGKGRLPIAKQKSGVYIPQEMVSGASAEAFRTAVTADLPARLQHELLRVLT